MTALLVAPGVCLKIGTSVEAVLSTMTPATAPECVDDNASVAVSSGATSIDVLANDSGDSLVLQNVAVQSGGGSVAIVTNEIEFTVPASAGTTVVTYEATNARGTDDGVLTIVITEATVDNDFGAAPATNTNLLPYLLSRWS